MRAMLLPTFCRDFQRQLPGLRQRDTWASAALLVATSGPTYGGVGRYGVKTPSRHCRGDLPGGEGVQAKVPRKVQSGARATGFITALLLYKFPISPVEQNGPTLPSGRASMEAGRLSSQRGSRRESDDGARGWATPGRPAPRGCLAGGPMGHRSPDIPSRETFLGVNGWMWYGPSGFRRYF